MAIEACCTSHLSRKTQLPLSVLEQDVFHQPSEDFSYLHVTSGADGANVRAGGGGKRG